MTGGVCFHVWIPAAAGVLQDPSDASLFSISSWQHRETCNRAAGEFGQQLTEVFRACRARVAHAAAAEQPWCLLHVQLGRSTQAAPEEDLGCGCPKLMALLHCYSKPAPGWVITGTDSMNSQKANQ